MMAKKSFFLMLLILWVGVCPALADMAIVVNKDNPITAISRTDLALIYQGRKKMFLSGEIIIPVDIASRRLRQEFFSRILQKDEESYRLYWVRMIFSGKGQPPLAFKTEEEAVKFVASNKGAIAFMDSSRISGDVKMIRVLEDE